MPDEFETDHWGTQTDLEPLRDVPVRGLFTALDHATAGLAAGSANDFREAGSGTDRVGDAASLDICPAALRRAQQSAPG